MGVQPDEERDRGHEPPRGAFLLIVLYLVLLTALWANVYLQLWQRG
ncbi:MAG TPA: hypothetical protein VIN09_08245 [Chloroflexota bacterium]